mmetsp:Transcript_93319/g.260936  ORF Transcript_93319/g.260936 Transcript_93319/m.260936 type:complete len:237 (-) Transcript_93319:633-1343(-)
MLSAALSLPMCTHLRGAEPPYQNALDAAIAAALADSTGEQSEAPGDSGAHCTASDASGDMGSASAPGREAEPPPNVVATQGCLGSATSSTSHPRLRSQGCGPGSSPPSSFQKCAPARAAGVADSGSSSCGGIGHTHAPFGDRPIGHSAIALAGPPPAKKRALRIGRPGRPTTSSRNRSGTWHGTSTRSTACLRAAGGRQPCSMSHSCWSESLLSSPSPTSAGTLNSSPRMRTTAKT